MAAVSTLQAPKRKKLVYGKAGKSAFGGTNFFDDDEDELSAPQPTIARQGNVKATYPVQKTEAKSHRVKEAKPRARQHDTFDVPSSDDETDGIRERRKMTPPKYRPTLIDDTREQHLAPWERKRKAEASAAGQPAITKRHKTPEGSPEAQLKRELARATQSPEALLSLASTRSSVSPAPQRSSPVTSPPSDGGRNVATSALARLAARKRLAQSNVPSSADEGSLRSTHSAPTYPFTTNATPRKRVRKTVEAPQTSEDVVMEDAEPVRAEQSDAVDVFDFPGSDDESSKRKVLAPRVKPRIAKDRRGKGRTYSRSTPLKGISAPARLAEMINTDTDSTEPPTRSPSVSTSRHSTPQQPSTPPPGQFGSPLTAVKANGTVTPKQANLWNRLLPSDPVASSPSGLPIQDLTISGNRRPSKLQFGPRLNRSQSDTTRRRTRLVDRLKAATPDSDDEASDEYETEDALHDVEMLDQTSRSQDTKAVEIPKLQRQPSQSQSQTTSSKVGPKITYSRARTYLAEDNLEADLMLGLDSEPPQPAMSAKRNLSNKPQNSAYDLEDSDEDDAVGKIRSIHELRAAGSNVRGMGDIEDLLEDISKHSSTQRGTRRTALITLAMRLTDKVFKDRFVGQSCEVKLAGECGACEDEVADFATTASVALLLNSNPAEHVVLSFQDGRVLDFLANHIDKTTPIDKLAKDRRSNMSKASQTWLTQFAEKMRLSTSLWGEHPPTTMTHRAMALKAVDLLVRALRRRSNTSELLNSRQILSILPNSICGSTELDPIDTMLAVSTLESLSTTAATLDWPSEIFESVAWILPRLGNLNQPRDIKFLALRLCLNLTNNNEINCAIMAGSNNGSIVPHLLEAIQLGFGDLGRVEDAEEKAIALDVLVLAIGFMINLSEHSDQARQQALVQTDGLEALVGVFQYAQQHMLEAVSEEESVANVTFGYLAVMLANLCQYGPAKAFIASKLPGQNLRLLVAAVEEFVAHHEKVDTLNFEGEEGAEVWSAFTEKLKEVSRKLKAVEAA